MPRRITTTTRPHSPAPHPGTSASRTGRDRAIEPRATQLLLRWSLSRAAAAAAGLVCATGIGEPALEVRVPWDAWGVEGVRAAIMDGDRQERIVLEWVTPGTWCEEPGERGGVVRHVELPGVLRFSAVLAAEGIRVLYARTELLGRLGMPGGRYDLERATLMCELA